MSIRYKKWVFGAIFVFAALFVFAVLIVIWSRKSELAQFIGYLLGGLLLSWQIAISSQRATAAEKTAEAMQKTAQSTEKGNIDERFKNAIEHLGHESVSIRLGGIYALHHIAQEVEEYHERVFEILCAHIREITTQEAYKPRIIEPTGEEPTIEIQSILNLLFVKIPGRKIYEGLEANLEKAYLKGTQLVEAYLKSANFSHAILDNANLSTADLQGAFLYRASLQESNLEDSDFQNANLKWSKLKNANLDNANLYNAKLLATDLQGASLQVANLQVANLQVANLQGANLQGANLQGANLQGASLQGATLQETGLQGADLQETDLREANLRETNLRETNLVGAKNLEVEQLLKAKALHQAQLPDGMEEIIRKKKPELLEKPSGKKDA